MPPIRFDPAPRRVRGWMVVVVALAAALGGTWWWLASAPPPGDDWPIPAPPAAGRPSTPLVVAPGAVRASADASPSARRVRRLDAEVDALVGRRDPADRFAAWQLMSVCQLVLASPAERRRLLDVTKMLSENSLPFVFPLGGPASSGLPMQWPTAGLEREDCETLTPRQRADAHGWLEDAARAGVRHALSMLLEAGPAGDADALRQRGDDLMVRAWRDEVIDLALKAIAGGDTGFATDLSGWIGRSGAYADDPAAEWSVVDRIAGAVLEAVRSRPVAPGSHRVTDLFVSRRPLVVSPALPPMRCGESIQLDTAGTIVRRERHLTPLVPLPGAAPAQRFDLTARLEEQRRLEPIVAALIDQACPSAPTR